MPLQKRSGNMAALPAPPAPRFKFECPDCGHVEIYREASASVTCRACAGRYTVTNTLALQAVAAAIFPGGGHE